MTAAALHPRHWFPSLCVAVGLFASIGALGQEIVAPGPVRTAGDALAFEDEVEVSLRTLYVTVTRHHQRVLDLEREDFSLDDGGRTVPILTFERGDVPFTAILVVDLSASMTGRPAALAHDLVTAFARLLGPNDEVQLVGFGGAVAFASPLGSSPSALLASLAALPSVAPGSAPHDALAAGGALLAPRLGRKVLVLVSDGIDLHSVVTPSMLRAAMLARGILVYWIRPTGPTASDPQDVDLPREEARLRAAMATLPPASSWRPQRQAAVHREELAALVTGCGGRVIEVREPTAIPSALDAVVTELRNQYVLGYRARDGESRPTVGVKRRGHVVRVAGD